MTRMSRQRTLIALAILGCGALAGCGSTGAPSGTVTDGANPSSGGTNPALQFAGCMRAHGVTNFPDPGSRGEIQINAASGLNPQSPAFQTAQTACNKYLPNKGQPPVTSAANRAKAVAFSKCMRTHGEPEFPDPMLTVPRGSTRVLAFRGMAFAVGFGLDPRSPAFQQAATACGVRLSGFVKTR
jgi:hypothetical protein